jgi:hypothetical protein
MLLEVKQGNNQMAKTKNMKLRKVFKFAAKFKQIMWVCAKLEI